jgi:hypothetical protein
MVTTEEPDASSDWWTPSDVAAYLGCVSARSVRIASEARCGARSHGPVAPICRVLRRPIGDARPDDPSDGGKHA